MQSRTLRAGMLALIAMLFTGCGSIIHQARFSAGSGSPQGSVPGNPTDDHITVQSTANPTLNAGVLVFNATNHTTSFFSRSVGKPDSTKTISWRGQLNTGSGPFHLHVTAYHTVSNTFPTDPLLLRFTNNQVSLLDHNDAELKSGALLPNGPHEVFISLRLGSGTYYISIKQPGAAEILWQGSLPQPTTNWIKSQPRILLMANFFNGTGTYTMDDVIMREKE
jgi:hypothetical protein